MTSHFKKVNPLAPVIAYEKWHRTRPAAHISAPSQCYVMNEDKVLAVWLSAWESARKEYA